MPDLASSLQNLLDYEGDVKEDFMMKFEVSVTEFDVVKSVALKENGQNIDLTNENRKEYVDLYVDFLLNKSIYEQFKAFYFGKFCFIYCVFLFYFYTCSNKYFVIKVFIVFAHRMQLL